MYHKCLAPTNPSQRRTTLTSFLTTTLLVMGCILTGTDSPAAGQSGAAAACRIVLDASAGQRARYGAERLMLGMKDQGLEVSKADGLKADSGTWTVVVGNLKGPASKTPQGLIAQFISVGKLKIAKDEIGPEGFVIAPLDGAILAVVGDDDSGALYGCLQLKEMLATGRRLKDIKRTVQTPVMRLRGTCIGMQKPELLPGRAIYDYPYTPKNFPFFYNKKRWLDYLDFLAANRMNTLYLWNGHPFPSLVKLDKYPYAVEVSDETLKQNQAMFRFLTREANRRGIWVIQMFYNIYVSKPFAEHNHLGSTTFRKSTPLISDYNRRSIAKFVETYPHVGLLACLGEALRGQENQKQWLDDTIVPGVKEGMKLAGLTEEPPIVIRAHAVGDPKALIQSALPSYKNLYTMAKYNGESLTTWQPRGKWRRIHRQLSETGGTEIANVHILSNLEPFRYGDTLFIQRCVQAMVDVEHCGGLHLYPLAYWNWPYSSDKTNPPLIQYKRDWIWFAAWARYAWNPYRTQENERHYWSRQLGDRYGSEKTGEWILAAYNNAGECAPVLVRRFGITEGNRQTLSLGMFLDQLVHAKKYRTYPELWESHAPIGERIKDTVKRDWEGLPHFGETPIRAIEYATRRADRAVEEIDHAEPLVTKDLAEFERLRNDVHCIQALTHFYNAKVRAALLVLRYEYSKNPDDMRQAVPYLEKSVAAYRRLTDLTRDTYNCANLLQTSQRKIPLRGGEHGHRANYLWSQLLPHYEQELADFKARVAKIESGANATGHAQSKVSALPSVPFQRLTKGAEVYEVKPGAKVFTDRPNTIEQLAGELNGLRGVRISQAQTAAGNAPQPEFDLKEPAQILIGYFDSPDKKWLQVPDLDTDAAGDEHGNYATVIENAATIEGLPAVAIHAFHVPAGHVTLDLHGTGSYVILGVVPESTKIAKRNAHLPAGK